MIGSVPYKFQRLIKQGSNQIPTLHRSHQEQELHTGKCGIDSPSPQGLSRCTDSELVPAILDGRGEIVALQLRSQFPAWRELLAVGVRASPRAPRGWTRQSRYSPQGILLRSRSLSARSDLPLQHSTRFAQSSRWLILFLNCFLHFVFVSWWSCGRASVPQFKTYVDCNCN